MSKIDYTTRVHDIAGAPQDLSAQRGRVMLIVNTASKCGYTPQLKGLQRLHDDFAYRGLSVMGFPCNQFGKQEPDAEPEIARFCAVNYGVSFNMHRKIEVNGPGAHPLFVQLAAAAPGLLGTRAIKWNFTKFLVGRDGTILRRYGPRDTPESLTYDIEAALAAPEPQGTRP